MDKKFFLLASAALVLTACSNEESVDVNNGDAIGFRTSVSSRGTVATYANLNNFAVTALDETGVDYFKNVTFEIENGSYHSHPDYYWPKKGSLDFIAYTALNNSNINTLASSSDVQVAKTGEGTALSINNFTPAQAGGTNIDNQLDLIVAAALEQEEYIDENNNVNGVQLNFRHMLSQIEIQAKNANVNYTFDVVGVRIGGVSTSGDLIYTAAPADEDPSVNWKAKGSGKYSIEWDADNAVTLNETAQLLTRAVASVANASTGSVEENNAFLIPQGLTAWKPQTGSDRTYTGGAYIAVKVKITSAGGKQIYPAKAGEYDWVAVPVSGVWAWNKKYVYTLDFQNGAGNVDPEKPDPQTGDEPVDPDDPFRPGDEILGGKIFFNVNQFTWGDGGSTTLQPGSADAE